MHAPCGGVWSSCGCCSRWPRPIGCRARKKPQGGEPVGWQRWRRQLIEQTRDLVIVCAQGYDGIFHMAEDLLQVGVSIKDRPPGIGMRQEVLARYDLIPKA